MDGKFEDINWDERLRLAKGQSNHPNFEWKWGNFRQPDVQTKGLMDRYANIKPWNHNRVKLLVSHDQLDYVNASHVQAPPSHDASLRPLRYIAMQGPTEPSIPYVWRMIAEQSESPSVIVQLTSNAEGGAVKCNQYFPEGAGMTSSGSNGGQEDARWRLNEQDVWGDGWRATLTVESAELLCDDAIERRRLTLRIDGEQGPPRVIWHFWYRRWPDFGVISPGDYDTFFELMKLSREHSSPRAPRVIHCSAGVGRTGTFIALEHLLRELDVGAFRPGSSSTPSLSSAAGSQDNGSLASPRRHDVIFDTVQHLRQQRRGMVQSEQQYRFLYQVLRRRWIDTYRSHGAGTPTAAVAADEDEDDRTDDGGASLLKVPGSATASNHQLTDVESYDGSAVNQEMDDDEDDDRHDAHEQQDDQDEEDEEDDDDGGGAKVETDSLPAAPADNMTAGGISVADKLKSNAATKSPHSGAVGRAAMMKKRAKRLLFD